MPNTEDTLGEQGLLDAFVCGTITDFEDDRSITPAIEISHSNGQWQNIKRFSLKNWVNASYVKNMPKLETLEIGSIYSQNTLATKTLPRLTHLLLRSQSTGYATAEPLPHTLISFGLGAVYVPDRILSLMRGNQYWGQYRIEPLGNYPVKLDTIEDTWEQIVTACGNGAYASRYDVGDTKEITVDGKTVYATLVAKDADVLDSDGVTTVPTTWVCMPVSIGMSNMNTNNATYKDKRWDQSYLRSRMSYYLGKINNETVRGAIKTVRKTHSYVNGSGVRVTETCGDALWVPSLREFLPAGDARLADYESDGPCYDLESYKCFYNDQPVTTSSPSDYMSVWTRTGMGRGTNPTAFGIASSSSGTVSVNTVNGTDYQGFCIGFCI